MRMWVSVPFRGFDVSNEHGNFKHYSYTVSVPFRGFDVSNRSIKMNDLSTKVSVPFRGFDVSNNMYAYLLENSDFEFPSPSGALMFLTPEQKAVEKKMRKSFRPLPGL